MSVELSSAHVDAPRRAHAGAELAADALLHAVLVAVEDVAPVEAERLGPLLVGVLLGDDVPDLAQGDEETREPL